MKHIKKFESSDDLVQRIEKIYNDIDKILGAPVYINGLFVKRETDRRNNGVTDEKLEMVNKYLEDFLDEENRGILRTILVCLKPYKNNPIVADNLKILADRLRAGSKTGFI